MEEMKTMDAPSLSFGSAAFTVSMWLVRLIANTLSQLSRVVPSSHGPPAPMPTFSTSPSSPPSFAMRFLDHARDVVFLRDIGGDRERAAFAQRDRRFRRFGIAIRDGDLRALAREQHAHRAAIADRRVVLADIHLPAADDKNALACQPASAGRSALAFVRCVGLPFRHARSS